MGLDGQRAAIDFGSEQPLSASDLPVLPSLLRPLPLEEPSSLPSDAVIGSAAQFYLKSSVTGTLAGTTPAAFRAVEQTQPANRHVEVFQSVSSEDSTSLLDDDRHQRNRFSGGAAGVADMYAAASQELARLDVEGGEESNGASEDPHWPPKRWGERDFGTDVSKQATWAILRREITKQLLLSYPICGMNILNYLIVITSVIYVGHLGKVELASSAIAGSLANVTGISTMMGLAGALETLCGQAYGAHNFGELGIHMQRGFFVLSLVALPIGALWLYLGPILRLMGQDPQIADMAGIYAFYLLPMLFAQAWIQPILKFMQAQSVVAPMAVVSLGTLVLAVPANYLLIHTLGLGFRGAAMAASLATCANLLGLAAYLRFSPRFQKTWGGWSWRALTGLGGFLWLAAPSWSMLCLEYWCFEAVILLAGLLPNPELQVSSLSICLNTAELFYMTPLGLSAAASTRVANEVGAARPNAAKHATSAAFVLATADGAMASLFILSVRSRWGWLFSSNPDVVALVASLLRIQVVLIT